MPLVNPPITIASPVVRVMEQVELTASGISPMCSHERVRGEYMCTDEVSLDLLSCPPTIRRATPSVVVLEYSYGTSGSVFQTDCCSLLPGIKRGGC